MGILTKMHYREFKAYMAHKICFILVVETKMKEKHELLEYKKKTKKGKRKAKEKEKDTRKYVLIVILCFRNKISFLLTCNDKSQKIHKKVMWYKVF